MGQGTLGIIGLCLWCLFAFQLENLEKSSTLRRIIKYKENSHHYILTGVINWGKRVFVDRVSTITTKVTPIHPRSEQSLRALVCDIDSRGKRRNWSKGDTCLEDVSRVAQSCKILGESSWSQALRFGFSNHSGKEAATPIPFPNLEPSQQIQSYINQHSLQTAQSHWRNQGHVY